MEGFLVKLVFHSIICYNGLIKEAEFMNYGKKGTEKKQKSLTSNTAKVSKKFVVTFFQAFIIAILAVGIFGMFAGFGVVKGIIDSAPDISSISVIPIGYSTFVYDQDGKELTKLVSKDSNRIPISIDKIPKKLQNAFVAIEDERFWTHNGIDIKGIIRAGFKGIKSGKFSEGASTITQQLLKNNVFKDWVDETSMVDKFKRKFQEQYLAIRLEETMDKEEILQNYLNTINLGQNTLGVQAASKRYFNKDVSQLSISECAVIAAITQNPTWYNPISNPEHNAERREKVLNNMRKHEYITELEFNEAMADNVYERIQNVNEETEDNSIYSYFVDELVEQVMADLQEKKGYTYTQAYYALYSGGLKIYTTQDSKIQQICDEEFENEENYPAGTNVLLQYELSTEMPDGETKNYSAQMLEAHFKKSERGFNLIFKSREDALEKVEQYKAEVLEPSEKVIGEKVNVTPQPQCSITVMDQNSGYVKALVGGRGPKEGSLTLNRATNTVRQPGSTFKVVSAYAPALDNAGMTLASVQDDTNFNYSDGRPVSNWYKTGYRGLCTLRYGIEQSLNIVAVKTLTDVTPRLGYDYLLNFGFTTLVEREERSDGKIYSDITQSLALGGVTDGVTNLELNAAYAAIANGGTHIKPIFYTKILDYEGNILIENTPETNTVIKETTAFLLTSAMQDVVSKGTGGACRLENQVVAGKTGTTSKNIDVWFAGFTPYYTATVWAGYDNNVSLTNDEKNFHKKIWKNVMNRIHEELPKSEFPIPDGIETASVCKKSGKLAVAGICDADPRGSQVITEYFAEGTTPTEYCDTHVRASVCIFSGTLAGEFCPLEARVEKVFILRPASSMLTNADGITYFGETDDTPYSLTAEQLANGCPLHGGAPTVPYSGAGGAAPAPDILNGVIPGA